MIFKTETAVKRDAENFVLRYLDKRFSYNIAHIITLCVKLGFIQALFYLTQTLQSQTKSGIFSIILQVRTYCKS